MNALDKTMCQQVRIRLVCFFFQLSLSADLAVTILQPGSNFVTNNQVLHLQAEIFSTEPSLLIVSVNTPSGIQSLEQVNHSIQAIEVDLSQPLKIKSLLIQPVIQSHDSLGPRTVSVSFSEDGQAYSSPLVLFAPATLEPDLRRVLVNLPSQVMTRYIRLEMVEGWQKDRIAIRSFELLNDQDQIVQANLKRLSVLLNTSSQGISIVDKQRTSSAILNLNLMLRNGENRITVSVRQTNNIVKKKYGIPFESEPTASREEMVQLYYLAELNSSASLDGYFTLSDGAKAEIHFSSEALGPRVKKLQFSPIPVAEISRLTYLNNPRIVEETAPVIAYRFEALRQQPLIAVATSQLPYQPASLAVDGVRVSPSTWMSRLTPLPISLTIDLAQKQSVGKLIVYSSIIDGKSFGPKSCSIHLSDDNIKFARLMTFDNFDKRKTIIDFPTRPQAQFVRIEVTESQQVNNVQIDEIEFFDPSDAPITTFSSEEHLILHRPAQLELSYDSNDLILANITQAENLRLFTWEASSKEWQIVGGIVDPIAQTVRIQLNYIATFAIFEAVNFDLGFAWSFNPFSPDGDGIADTTRLMLDASNSNPYDNRRQSAKLVVEIFDIRNKLIRTLIDHSIVDTEAISIEWDGKDLSGSTVDIGVYIYHIKLGAFQDSGIIAVGR